jgi:hypothetical protein
MRSKMKGIDSTRAHLVHVPGWVDGSKSRFKDCSQQSKIKFDLKQELNIRPRSN